MAPFGRAQTVARALFATVFLWRGVRFSLGGPPATAAVQLRDQFPTLNETLHMSSLSLLVYRFVNDPDNDDAICARMNQPGYQPSDDNDNDSNDDGNDDTLGKFPDHFLLPSDFHCHWYYHDREHEGTQLMIASSRLDNYLAVVFAGTDDYQTSLRDLDILKKPFGDDGHNWTLPEDDINNKSFMKRNKVHAGFDNAVFQQGLMDRILIKLEAARNELETRDGMPIRLYTTGHSLGAAGSVLTAVALTTYYHKHYPDADAAVSSTRPTVTSLNFGCPCVGNKQWRDYIHTSLQVQDLAIWRFVLGWDLVPRLPELFYHVGHTVQLKKTSVGESDEMMEHKLETDRPAHDSSWWWNTLERVLWGRKDNDDDDDSQDDSIPFQGTAKAYYQHYGDQKNYASVPLGWNSLPYIWVPGAIASHHAARYWQFFYDFQQRQYEKDDGGDTPPVQWVSEFVPFSPDNTDDKPPHVDDDFYVDPPDDDSYLLFEQQEEDG